MPFEKYDVCIGVQNHCNYNIGSAIEELFIHELVHASLDKPIFGHYKSINKKRHENKNIKSITDQQMVNYFVLSPFQNPP